MTNVDTLDYNKMLDNALLSIVKSTLSRVSTSGAIGNHYFYITFKTDINGVVIPDFLKKQYPDNLTIVIQHEFSNLSINDKEFGITLSFNNYNYHLIVPFNAVMVFSDPSVDFSLTFNPYNVETHDAEPQLTLTSKDDGNIISLSDFMGKKIIPNTPDDVA